MAPKIAVVYYSTWGHIQKLAEAEVAGIEKAGGKADLFQIPETLPEDLLKNVFHAPPKPAHINVLKDPTVLQEYDGFLFGIPTRFGNFPAQWKVWWDSTGHLWQQSGYWGKFAGIFVASAGMGGGQESTCLATMSTFAHHGMIYVPLGYKHNFKTLQAVDEVRGGSPWGAGTFSKSDGSRQPTERELELASSQGSFFWQIVSSVDTAAIQKI